MVPAHRVNHADHLCIVSRSCKTEVSTEGEEKDHSREMNGKNCNPQYAH